MNAEEILVALAVKYKGNWETILSILNRGLDDITSGEDIEEYDLENWLEVAKNSDYKYTTILSDDYPEIVKKAYMPPFVLFYHGDISLLKNIGNNLAVVGSRDCSEYGAEMTKKIVSEVCRDFNIVSGLARGIDSVAHETAIKSGGKTIAVLAGGINYCYPLRNRELYNIIKENHLVISEYPGDTVPEPYFFPRRNRIISMISSATLVTEAYEKSGTLTTVMFSLQCERLILCVPYLATSNSECNRLIAEGAYLVQNGNDVLEILKKDSHI